MAIAALSIVYQVTVRSTPKRPTNGVKNAEETGDLLALPLAFHDYGALHSIKGDWKVAVEYLQKGLEGSKEITQTQLIMTGHLMLGFSYAFWGDYKAGRTHVEEANKIANDTDREVTLGGVHGILGYILQE